MKSHKPIQLDDGIINRPLFITTKRYCYIYIIISTYIICLPAGIHVYNG